MTQKNNQTINTDEDTQPIPRCQKCGAFLRYSVSRGRWVCLSNSNHDTGGSVPDRTQLIVKPFTKTMAEFKIKYLKSRGFVVQESTPAATIMQKTITATIDVYGNVTWNSSQNDEAEV